MENIQVGELKVNRFEHATEPGWKTSELLAAGAYALLTSDIFSKINLDDLKNYSEQFKMLSDVLKGLDQVKIIGLTIVVSLFIIGRVLIKLFEIKYGSQYPLPTITGEQK